MDHGHPGHRRGTSWRHAGLPYQAGCLTLDAQCGSAQQAAHLVAGLELERRGAGTALITMCTGGAMATATIIGRI